MAKFFEKQHFHVLRDIAKITDTKSGLSEEFIKNNFTTDTYKDSTGRKLPCCQMTRDGFTMLVMGYSGAKAMHFKELYIKRFNEMERFIKTLMLTRKEFPLLTEQIRFIHKNPKPYHYSNECDMINRIVIGMTAKKFRELNNIPKGESIRPYLTEEQLNSLEKLQIIDVGLMVVEPDLKKRKLILESYLINMECAA
ncbi:MAG: Rha family transcriptional regulator [Ruminococcus sp.]|nr:Rha family transcriptional regulator [Ruminococcus sp.]